ncbi:Amidase [Popillia japonica]|uniref:Amidase n=1 Tax=Popillia japonica TaxID=7064 RepID=A0AAW1JH54_POPJA
MKRILEVNPIINAIVEDRFKEAHEIVQVYMKRILEVNPIINAIVEDRFKEALDKNPVAKEVDKYLDKNPDKINELKTTKPFLGIPITVKEAIAVRGKLHLEMGIPITVKEAIAVRGMSYTGGSVTRKNIKAEKDSVVVQHLKNAGLIPLLVSNTPEYDTSLETYNKLSGYTYNPYNTLYTCGGSSGGEGALLGAGASLLGVGSDFFGSIRVPAMWNGVFGHKPSKQVVSLEGHFPIEADDLFQNRLVIGPMARYAEDLKPLLKIMAGNNVQKLHLDDEGPMARYAEDLKPLLKIMAGNNVQKLHLDDEVNLDNIQIFYMEDTGNCFGLLNVEKEIRVAVYRAATYLQKECHCHISNRKFEELSESIEMVTIEMMGKMKKFPSPLHDTNVKYNVLIETVKAIFGKSRFTFHHLLSYILYKAVQTLVINKQKYTEKLEKLKEVLLDALGDNGVFLYPCAQIGPFKLGGHLATYPITAYTAIPNLLGLPATAVPTGFNANKLPIGIQVIAGPNQDRLTLAVAQELEKCFGGWKPPS